MSRPAWLACTILAFISVSRSAIDLPPILDFRASGVRRVPSQSGQVWKVTARSPSGVADGTTPVPSTGVSIGTTGKVQVRDSAQVTVTDARGAADTATVGVVIGAVADRGPPTVTLTAPAEALPGSRIVVTAQAALAVHKHEILRVNEIIRAAIATHIEERRRDPDFQAGLKERISQARRLLDQEAQVALTLREFQGPPQPAAAVLPQEEAERGGAHLRFHLQHHPLIVVAQPHLGAAVLAEDAAARLHRGLHDDGVEGAGRNREAPGAVLVDLLVDSAVALDDWGADPEPFPGLPERAG